METSSCLSLSAEMCSPKLFPPIPPKRSTGARLQAFGSQKTRILIITTHSQAFRKTEDLGEMGDKETRTGSGN